MIAKTFSLFLLISTLLVGNSFISRTIPLQNVVFNRKDERIGFDTGVALYVSRMPVFDEEDEEQLRKIMAGEFWEDDMPDFSDNLPTRERKRTKSVEIPVAPVAPVVPISASAKKVLAPNANWRTATNAPIAQNPLLIPKPTSLIVKKKKPAPAPSADYLDFSDLDYDDFESAMR